MRNWQGWSIGERAGAYARAFYLLNVKAAARIFPGGPPAHTLCGAGDKT